ncbi:hypothetical protein LOC68_16240 [Blastopirellula sp. JC732]|uniref:Uncharacterized protein n=1 Tax=Blastopirellula sediminis TaxID=2894196 RepID=A0A9X1MPA8_9BACT|nr:hypothetical protein [Blastopirellula sediminis]MCC9606761.1 hypothetical protein [Blastopirellula sediminis]MCC9629942.1 hypothetical protein [Blastopirellula sediminis]
MSHESSASVTLRSLVMLAFLIFLPAAALAPDGLRRVVAAFQQSSSETTTVETPEKPLGKPQVRPTLREEASSDSRAFPLAEDPFAESLQSPGADKIVPVFDEHGPSLGKALDGILSQRSSELEDQLQQMGASYYRLEAWGENPRIYRFHCMAKVRYAGKEESKRFEATAEHPIDAMQKTLELLHQWHKELKSRGDSQSR